MFSYEITLIIISLSLIESSGRKHATELFEWNTDSILNFE